MATYSYRSLLLAMLFALGVSQLAAQEKRADGTRAWTLDEAIEQLRLYPRDTYLQYVALQLARRENRLSAVESELRQVRGTDDFFDRDRREQVDLFNIFSGALAIQESLQLDTMRGEATAGSNLFPNGQTPEQIQELQAKRREERVQLAAMSGPTIKSHPWKEMLGAKRPEISPLARNVPSDFYFVEFHSLAKLLDLLDAGDLWGRHLFSQAEQEARTHFLSQKLKQQLAVETNPLLRPFYDQVVTEVAVTGSDLFVREGSDVTLLFRFQFPDVFKARMDQFLNNAAKSRPDARQEKGEIQGVQFVHVSTPDRSVNVYSAYPVAGLHIRTNSRVALERIVAAIQGKDSSGNAVERLGDTTEFSYIRTLMPRGTPEEDGFIYLSDPFIRRLVGPQLKLTERRRMVCYNHLRMIGHAALMYQTEQGRPAESLAALEKANCTPGKFGKSPLACPDHGKYGLSADGVTGVCSHHGQARSLTPCCEIPLKEVNGLEAEAYEQFLNQYNSYWRNFFDPIAIRVQVTPQRYRLETIILPLIDNSIYSGLVETIGGAAEPLESLPVPKRNIFSLAVHVNKESLLRQAGLEEFVEQTSKKEASPNRSPETLDCAMKMRQLGLALHNYHDVNRSFPTAVRFNNEGKRNRLSWRVHLLPFLGENELYHQFKLDEPWDSEHNRQLVPKMPATFQSSNQQLNAKGMTRLVAPVSERTIFSTRKENVDMAKITDGTSNTILIVEVDDAHAVGWTCPDDLEINLEQPIAGLARRDPGGMLVLLADGSIHFVRSSIDKDKFTGLLTRDGQEVVALQENEEVALRFPGENRVPFDLVPQVIEELQLGRLISQGIGNQVGFHVYDAEPQFDFSLPSFLGRSVGSLQRSRMDDEILWISFLVASLNSPVYLDVPVKDTAVVDEFLERLDEYLASFSRDGRMTRGWFGLRSDFYEMHPGDSATRCYSIQIGPLKARVFWARIGKGLYLASQPYILDDLRAIQSAAKEPSPAGPTAHAMVHLRPQNWSRVLANYNLGWAENNRQACLHNLGPLSHVCRAIPGTSEKRSGRDFENLLQQSAARVYDTQFFCPDGGRYVPAADGMRVSCSVHGTAESPRQPAEPTKDSELGRLLRDFADMTLTLSFLEDGLHTVVTIDRH